MFCLDIFEQTKNSNCVLIFFKLSINLFSIFYQKFPNVIRGSKTVSKLGHCFLTFSIIFRNFSATQNIMQKWLVEELPSTQETVPSSFFKLILKYCLTCITTRLTIPYYYFSNAIYNLIFRHNQIVIKLICATTSR